MARKKQISKLPSFDELLIPTVKALIELGGSGSVEEINTKVYEIAEIAEEVLQIPHGDQGKRSEVDYRLAWSKTYLRKFGLLENSSRGIWALSKPEIDVSKLNHTEIVKTVRDLEKPTLSKPKKEKKTINEIEEEVNDEVDNTEEWKDKLLNVLYNITPAAFERLSQRLLRESGFVQVEVTGKVGDGGIDGKGIVRISGLLSFHVIFQCKRYKGSVSPSQIRDFRGAMQGRADKGLFITTGTFTREAIKEATRDGAPPIDLIDGELLCEKLKELKLGIDTKLTETVEIKNDWFGNL
ncbi:MAG: restriction endonuclease [Flavobacterium nitrogenifigens]|uniref:restriction endonuclease n=1 Tax=Flavobacterium nitrogenifigens TaxID=1617283 RepID=UPI00280829A9|nr:restriction endonuclease [Flavobacterium nitrogenifigens]MDQ8015105.1 restriction endonuclease [Flavobacterium nitrogenifigens]MDQ8054297.1 restriction endonuclease [Pedobacter sp.]